VPASDDIRGTQSFVHTLSACWQRPSLTALEVAWRWAFGIPAVALLVREGRQVLLAATGGTMDPATLGLDRTFVNDPVGALSADPLGAVTKVGSALAQVLPGLWSRLIWMGPLLLVVWVIISSLGRTVVLRRADSKMHQRIGTLMGLQAIRAVVLATICSLWFWALMQCGAFAVTGPLNRHEEPNLVLYCGLVIVLSLGMFTAWAFVSWVLSVAPLLAMLKNLGVIPSLRAATQLGPLKGKLVEINLVLAIVKVALIVLAMVFSATPLPFEAVTTPGFLAWWWAGVTVLYLLWSDFFHVARLMGYLNLWRRFEDDRKGAI
jgi:hypothetical protein